MESSASEEPTRLLLEWRSGDEQARDRLFEIFYPWLRQAAAGMLRDERRVSLSTGDLVHDAVIRLVRLERIQWEDRAHFLALAARFMRRVVIEHVRAKQTDKRGHQKVELKTRFIDARPVDLVKLDEVLMRLAALDPARAELVEMRYFGGMTVADIAEVSGLSESTVERRWAAARVWLNYAMEQSL